MPGLTANFTREYWTAQWDLSRGFLLKPSFNYALLGLLTCLKLAPHTSSIQAFFTSAKIAHGAMHEYPATFKAHAQMEG